MSLHIDVLTGVSFGVLLGIVPAILVGILRFGLEYTGNYRLPRTIVVVIALAVAGGNGYLIEILPAPSDIAVLRLGVASVVVGMLALYADSQGAAYAARLPHRISEATRSDRTLSADALEDIDGSGDVRLTTTGTVANIEGYPPLDSAVRAAIEDDSWRLPADLPLSELEARLENRLRTEYDLAAVSVSVDDRARISIRAAPKSTDLAERIPDGERAVSVDTLLPTGLDRGDRVTIALGETSVTGTVLSAQTTPETEPGGTIDRIAEGESEATSGSSENSRATGEEGRVTVSVPEAAAQDVLEAESPQVTVTPREGNPAFEAFSHLRQVGKEIRKVGLTDRTRELIRETSEECNMVCIRRSGSESGDPETWVFHPTDADLDEGHEAFVACPRESELAALFSVERTPIKRGETS